MDYSFLKDIPGTNPKPTPRKKLKAKAKREKLKGIAAVRQYVFARERNVCRCCRFRLAESMHEIIFRSQGGKVSRTNSIACCGDGVRGCHGFMQRHEIDVNWGELRAEDELLFTAISAAAAEWCHVTCGTSIASPVMQVVESAE